MAGTNERNGYDFGSDGANAMKTNKVTYKKSSNILMCFFFCSENLTNSKSFTVIGWISKPHSLIEKGLGICLGPDIFAALAKVNCLMLLQNV